jgi:N-methylhydantoinase B
VTTGAQLSEDIDPVLFSVMLGRFNSIANEMTVTLEYSACTSILALCHDFSCAIYDAEGRQLCMYDALASHTASLQLVLQEIARTFEGEIADGDVYMCNDPYRYNSHIGDLVTATPVFVEDELLFWSVTKGHQMDTGAYIPSSVVASAQNVWQEGMRIPPLRIIDRGRMRKDVLDLYLTNMRYRDSIEGDLLAQLGSIEKGRQRLIELAEEFGPDVARRYSQELIDYSDRRMAEEIRRIPDGDYFGEGWIDSDGFDAFDIPIKVKVSVADDEVTVDLTGSGAQAQGGVNGSLATTMAAAAIPFLLYIDPDIPHNHGCLKHLKVIAPSGTIVNAEFPASTSAATIVPSDMIHDAINKAMAGPLPDRVAAGGARCQNVPQLAGTDSRTGEDWGVMLFNNTSGQGACNDTDGWPLWESVCCAGAIKVQAIEQLELLYPILIEQMEIEPESMGAGTFIGGPGTRCTVVPLHGDMESMTFGDGCANPPHGVHGGTAAIGGGMYVEDRTSGHRRYLSPTATLTVAQGDALVGISSGGGGFGLPHERDVEQVRRDARDGVISYATAREVYGVILSDDFDPVVDEAATIARRAELAALEHPPIQPSEPSAATWLAEHMRASDEYLVNPRAGA